MSLVERIAKKLARFGEQFTVGANTYRGVFKVLDSGTMRMYFDDVETMGITRPALLLITQPDAAITTGNTITRDGRVYTTLKTANQRVAGVVVAKLVFLA